MTDEGKFDTTRLIKSLSILFDNELKAKFVYDLMINLIRANIHIDALEKLLINEKVISSKKLDMQIEKSMNILVGDLEKNFFREFMKSLKDLESKTEK